MSGAPQSTTLEKLLKALILCEVVFTTGIVVENLFGRSLLPEALQAYVAGDENQEPTTGEWIVLSLAIALVVFSVIAWVALWRMKPVGRLLYAITWVSGIALSPFLGPLVCSWLGSTIAELESTAGALILGIVFFSDLRSRFQRPSPPPAAEHA